MAKNTAKPDAKGNVIVNDNGKSKADDIIMALEMQRNEAFNAVAITNAALMQERRRAAALEAELAELKKAK